MRRLTTLMIICLLLFPTASLADKYAGEFMALGGGARAMGMGSAFIAVADDATAGFWNPAGLATFTSMQALPTDWAFSLMHSERFGDIIDYNYASAAFPLRPGRQAGLRSPPETRSTASAPPGAASPRTPPA